MKLQTTLALLAVARHLTMITEILGEIDEREYLQLVKIAQKRTKEIENVQFSLKLGNVFMVAFRFKELIEAVNSQSNMPTV